ncbi:class I SAM-dependent methyltransferase [Amycolatopsis sp. FDAARGOS 1241]|uniref:class I SAM-dependent methyltransferase n=1 Tax=Amycolatopsis sp. FDAARGOS 1241 TaxID=2778070 RepID=UPI0019523380|nr:class I SAM-dependent methyltransferase [Amycolatopsis sp. FDAARGOS 1241]QRP46605.1 class I SAM-dependent methyltransferase [Amycolatopsis sp. FDAARGOS 1241]
MTDPTYDQELHARRASSFGPHAAAYAEHRPDYPLAALDWGLAGAAHPAQDVLDLAAGTGKLTQGLVDLGLTVTAVEPDAGMLAQLAKLLPDTTALSGKAEDIPLAGESVDAVFIGQALHWFDWEPAFAEIRRVLRPGGVVVALWNHDDVEVEWVVEFSKLVRGGVTRVALAENRTLDAAGFAPFEEHQFPHSHRRTIDSLLATVATHSNLLVADPADRDAALAAARDYLHSVPTTSSGEFDYPLITTALRARKV